MKYYEMHEIVYGRLKDDGLLSWDKAKTFEQMWSHSTNIFLEKFLLKLNKSFPGMKVLDLGTGTGTSALFAAMKGADSLGVDISSSAIEIANENAKKLNLNVEFIAGDVLYLDLKREFNVVIDSNILHCIVGLEDRRNFYDVVKRHMYASSYFLVNTMIASGDMTSRFPKEFFLFQDDVLWSLGINEISERKVINGKSYFPHRTLLSEARQLEEFREHGFEVIEMEKIAQKDCGFDLVALLKIHV